MHSWLTGLKQVRKLGDELVNATFLFSLFFALAIIGLGITGLISSKFVYWPPPQKGSWQDRSFIILFRGMLCSLLLLTYLRFKLEGISDSPALSIFGLVLLIVGFSLAFASTYNLGWKNAFGDKQGLVTNGWFAYSRNPVYLVTWFGLLGWGMLASNWQITIILTLWGILYILAIPAEEKWLEEKYGNEFIEYKERVPRIFWFL